LEVKLTEGKDLEQFNLQHGKHLEGVLRQSSRPVRVFIITNISEEKLNVVCSSSAARKSDKPAAHSFIFAGQKYQNIGVLKTVFKSILGRSSDGTTLKEPFQTMVLYNWERDIAS